ncbi:RluA family pseudouridine synthase [Pseudoflavonifractor sp. CLA-AP-H29]|uniref:Pseudouridine synthase n=1 Tax=Pseudoflavonifractor intestinihominis TaxID=3133171 RepID=A0ABV1E439_9FIRM
MDSPRRLNLTVTPEQTGWKVDELLRGPLALSGTVIRRVKWLEDGILLDGVRAMVGDRVRAGQVLSVVVGDTEVSDAIVPAPGPLDIVYRDQDVLVLNKAPGVAVHPGPGHYSDTIGNFLMDYYKKQGILADFHPVHRLDRGTSGLLLVALHGHAQEVLKEQLHTPNFRRVYLAVCEGTPEPLSGVIDAPIGRLEGSVLARTVRPDGQRAVTHYQTLRTGNGRSLVRLALETGRTHQIRVHMAHLGHPLTGDFLYGTEDPSLIPRPALHAAELAFTHPITGRPMAFTAPLPQDMAALVPEE